MRSIIIEEKDIDTRHYYLADWRGYSNWSEVYFSIRKH